MGFKDNWQDIKEWKVKICPTGVWGSLTDTDFIEFVGEWDTTTTPPTLKWVDINRITMGGSESWAKGCSFSTTPPTAGLEQVQGTTVAGKNFIITRTPRTPPAWAKLECDPHPALTGSRAGTWTAEEGGTMILPWEDPSYESQQA